MIFFNANKNKIFSLSVLTVATASLIFWQWLKFAPSLQITAQENHPVVEEIKDQTSGLLANAKDSISQAVEEFKNFPNEIEKEKNQQELLKATRQYLDQKN